VRERYFSPQRTQRLAEVRRDLKEQIADLNSEIEDLRLRISDSLSLSSASLCVLYG